MINPPQQVKFIHSPQVNLEEFAESKVNSQIQEYRLCRMKSLPSTLYYRSKKRVQQNSTSSFQAFESRRPLNDHNVQQQGTKVKKNVFCNHSIKNSFNLRANHEMFKTQLKKLVGNWEWPEPIEGAKPTNMDHYDKYLRNIEKEKKKQNFQLNSMNCLSGYQKSLCDKNIKQKMANIKRLLKTQTIQSSNNKQKEFCENSQSIMMADTQISKKPSITLNKTIGSLSYKRPKTSRPRMFENRSVVAASRNVSPTKKKSKQRAKTLISSCSHEQSINKILQKKMSYSTVNLKTAR